ncbi:MAG: outer membrane lipoprotein-sorting protein [Proteobacteria bacterium]|nr:outer membrane lipoprotein-sorting protein [Pseudomonadota bacterium]
MPNIRLVPRRRALTASLLLCPFLCLPASTARASDVQAAELPASVPKPAADSELTGRDIYKRVLDNRFESYIKTSTLMSGDRGGNTQDTRLRMWFQSLRREDGSPGDRNVLSKTLVKYLDPFDIRHTGYLVIHNSDRDSDQFIYLASQRRVRRVNLRGETVFGSDFSLEDILPRELEHATYKRLDDTDVHGVPCFLVEAVPTEIDDSDYSRFWVYVEKERYVPLRTRYWDSLEVEVKLLEVERAAIEQVKDVWIPMRSTMRNVLQDTFTTLVVDDIVPDPVFKRTDFELRRLESH